MRVYTAHRNKAANTPLSDMERHTYVYTTVFDDERQENAAIHAAATATTHKRSHSCKHSVFHQERLLDSSALHGRRREAAPI